MVTIVYGWHAIYGRENGFLVAANKNRIFIADSAAEYFRRFNTGIETLLNAQASSRHKE